MALTVVVLGAAPSPAAAYTESRTSYAGLVGINRAQGDKYSSGLNTVGGVNKVINIPAHGVTESGAYANYGQWVCQTTRLWALKGSWVVVQSDGRCIWMTAANNSAIFPRFYFGGLDSRVPYNIDVTTTWHFSDNREFGRSFVDYTQAGDYQCVVINCFTGSSPTVGAYLWFGL